MATQAELSALRLALQAAIAPANPYGPNPRVGCALVDADGTVISIGAHHGAGTPHAEVEALANAGDRATGATAVVTLEPCAHTGRTGPCTQALINAGVKRVVFAQTDPNPVASGGADVLRQAGIEVEGPVMPADAEAINHPWTTAVVRGTPFVTLKIASTLDGRIAAKDGTSRWITSAQAREQVHQLRSEVDAVLVGTGTVEADDPQLGDRRQTARHQPKPVVMGNREIPRNARIRQADFLQLQTHDPSQALKELFAADIRHMLIEGGATIAAAFLRADLVDRIVWFAAPKLLGAGTSAIGDLGIATITDALQWRIDTIESVGPDLRLDLSRVPTPEGS